MVSCGEDALQQTGFENQIHRLSSQCGYKWRWIPASGSADCSSSSKLRCFLAPAVYKRRAAQHHAVLYPSKSLTRPWLFFLLEQLATQQHCRGHFELWGGRREDPEEKGEEAAQVSFKATTLASCVWYSVCISLTSLCFLPGDNQKPVEHSEMALDTAEQVLPACEQGGWDSNRSSST